MIIHTKASPRESQYLAEGGTHRGMDFAHWRKKQRREDQAQADGHDDIRGNELKVFLLHRSWCFANKSRRAAEWILWR